MNAITVLVPILISLFSNLVVAQTSLYGVDVSTLTSVAAFQCLVANNYTHVIPRAWKVSGAPDTNCPATVANAWAGGMSNVDVYYFPCFKCGDPAGQITSAVNYLKSYNTNYTRFWIDVEGTQYWSNVTSLNVAFMQTTLDTGKNVLGLNLGIYASETQWTAILGNWTGGAGYPLWYPRYNNITSFDGWNPFAGWTQPFMKQYLGTTSICGASVDFNWFPAWPSPTASPSVTPSRSPTPSVTPSTTRTPSITPSVSPTSSVTPSVTPSSSITPTTSVTPSTTPSISVTPTTSPTPSRTPSRSPTPSITPTRSSTPSKSVTPSVTPYKLKHKTNEGVVTGVAFGAVGGGLLLAAGAIGAYVLVRRRRRNILKNLVNESEFVVMSAALAQ